MTAGDAELMAKPHYTSKMASTHDLETIETYGFRGEALGETSDIILTRFNCLFNMK